ncbi:MAG: hypothetical protein WCF92_02985 [bacterium]
MESFVKSDIFFFITTLCVVLVTILFVVILIYLIIVLKDVVFLSKKIKKEGEEIIDDAHNVRMDLKAHTKKASDFISRFSFLNKKTKRKKD